MLANLVKGIHRLQIEFCFTPFGSVAPLAITANDRTTALK